MYPSFWRMRAISTFSFDAGMSTRGRLAPTALRIRVSMSAIGSVIAREPCRSPGWSACANSSGCGRSDSRSPTALDDPGDVPLERQLAEAQPAQRELADVAAGAAAQPAAVPQADLVLRRLQFLDFLRGRGHLFDPCGLRVQGPGLRLASVSPGP